MKEALESLDAEIRTRWLHRDLGAANDGADPKGWQLSENPAKPCFRAVQSGCGTSAEDSNEKDWVEMLGVQFGANHRNWF